MNSRITSFHGNTLSTETFCVGAGVWCVMCAKKGLLVAITRGAYGTVKCVAAILAMKTIRKGI